MKKKTTSKIIAVLVAVFIFLIMPAQAFAADHTHNFLPYGYIYMYSQLDSTQHNKVTYQHLKCSCGAMAMGDFVSQKAESHVFGGEYYNGNNYHSSPMHYAQYQKDCAPCGYASMRLASYRCPGPPCIEPASIPLQID